jgi:hypothetical protein
MLLRFTAIALSLSLAACDREGNQGNLAGLDNQLAGNDADPALTSALQDQILVDPTLANQSNKNAVRPPETPTQAQYPPAQGAAGARTRLASAAQGGSGCDSDPEQFEYSRNWATRLPAAFPLYPGAQVSDAAANNKDGCTMRVVTFKTADAPQRVLDWYHTRAVRSGYSSEHQLREGDHILGGANDRDGGAFYLIVTPQQNGSEVALIANNGR